MKRSVYFVILQFALITGVYSQSTLEVKLRQHVYTLAADSLMGRKAGSVFSKKAADYIAAQWEEIGLTPLEGDSYFRPFWPNYQNLAAIIEGSDPALKDQYIIVGAHYDHLGNKVNNNGDTVIYNGADDNASGVATLIELGRLLKSSQSMLRKSVVLIAFDAEESGLFGSGEFADNPPFPIDNIELMISVDMVGWYKASGYVKYSGSGTINNGKQWLLEKPLIPDGLHVIVQNFEKSIFTATDTRSFAEKDIPTLSVTTGAKSPYHKPADMAHLIDFHGMTMITEHLANVIQTIAQDDSFEASGKIASKHKNNQKFTFGISANMGSNYHYYTKGALNGKPASAYNIGINGQLNMNYFAIRPEIYYDYIKANHPEGKITTHGITVPLNLVLQTPPSSSGGLAVFIGPYFSYKLKGKYDKAPNDFDIMKHHVPLDFDYTCRREEFGFNYGAEVSLVKLRLGVTHRSALTNFSRMKHLDDAHLRNRATYVSLSYLF